MQLNAVASWVLVCVILVESVVVLGLLIALVVLLTKGLALLQELNQRLAPSLDKADAVLTVTTEKIGSVSDRLEEILSQGEAVAETVYDKVDRTSTAVQRTIHAPLISLNSLAAGVSRGLHTFTRLQQKTSADVQSAPADTQGATGGSRTQAATATSPEVRFGADRVPIAAGGAPGRES